MALAASVALRGRGGGDFALHRVHTAARPDVDLVFRSGGDASGLCCAAVACLGQAAIAGEGNVVCVLVTYRLPSVRALAVERLLEFADVAGGSGRRRLGADCGVAFAWDSSTTHSILAASLFGVDVV